MVSFSLYWDLKVKVKCTLLNGDLPFGFLAWLWGPLSLVIDWYNYWSYSPWDLLCIREFKGFSFTREISVHHKNCVCTICHGSVSKTYYIFFLVNWTCTYVLFKLCCYGLWQVSNVDLHEPCVLESIINLHTGCIIWLLSVMSHIYIIIIPEWASNMIRKTHW